MITKWITEDKIIYPWYGRGYRDLDSLKRENDHIEDYKCLNCGNKFIIDQIIDIKYIIHRAIENNMKKEEGDNN